MGRAAAKVVYFLFRVELSSMTRYSNYKLRIMLECVRVFSCNVFRCVVLLELYILGKTWEKVWGSGGGMSQ